MHANQREDIDVAYAGDIVAGLGFKQTTTGDTLCERAHPIVLEQMEFPEPVISVAIEPKTKTDQDKLGKALGSLSDEDPTFRVHTDDETGQTIIARHGRAPPRGARRPDDARVQRRGARRQAAGRVPRDDHAAGREGRESATSARPVVAVSTPTSCIALEPTGPGGGYEFVDEIKGGVIPREYIPAVDAGIQEAMEGGVRRRLPARRRARPAHLRLVPRRRQLGDGVQDRRLDGAQGSGPQGQAAAARAGHGGRGRDAEEYMGDVIGDLNSRRGQVEGMEQRGSAQVITRQGARWPQMFGYVSDLRSRTQGRATYTMQFDSYQAGAGVDRAGDRRPGSRRVTRTSPYSQSMHSTSFRSER